MQHLVLTGESDAKDRDVRWHIFHLIDVNQTGAINKTNTENIYMQGHSRKQLVYNFPC